MKKHNDGAIFRSGDDGVQAYAAVLKTQLLEGSFHRGRVYTRKSEPQRIGGHDQANQNPGAPEAAASMRAASKRPVATPAKSNPCIE